MRLSIQGRTLVTGLGILALAMLASRSTFGEEPEERCELRFEVKATGVPLLDKIPYLSRLFKNEGQKPACCDELERLGVDFEIVPGQVIEFHGPVGVCPEICAVCPPPAARAVAAVCANETCAAEACPVAIKCCAGAKCCAAECCQVVSGEKSELWEHLAELTAENAALEATLEGHEAVLEAKAEVFESLAELMVENAKLEAKLEMVDHRDSMLKEMVELQAENAKLKAQAELAQQKEELLKSQLATVLENERLKQRVAELEQQQGISEEPVLTAKKPAKAKKTR